MKITKRLNRFITSATLATLALGAGAWAVGIPPLYRQDRNVYRYVIHTTMQTPYDGRKLTGWLTGHGYDVAGINWRAGEVEVITDDAGRAALAEKGIQGEVRRAHAAGLHAAASEIDARYLTYQKTEDALKALHAQFPNLTRLEQIGASLEGHPIWGLLISTTPVAGDPQALEKPSIIFDGMHHARELMSAEIVFDVGQSVLGAVQAHTDAALKLVERWNIWIVPMLNVDGNNVVWTKDSWWRKNTRGDGSNTYGVDINRNYPYRWAGCEGSSGSQTAEDYHGSAAASEPETQALMRLAAEVRPAASLSYHSYSELVLYPFGCDGQLTGENDLLKKIGDELAQKLPSDQGSDHYTPGTPWQILYAVDGDSMDYMFNEYGTTAFTFEVNQEFQPSYELRAPTLVKHRAAWQYFLDRIDTNMLALKVLDGKTGAPIAGAAVEISTIAHRFGEKMFRANAAGNYFKVLDPGNYSVRVTASDGRSSITAVVMQGHANGVVVKL